MSTNEPYDVVTFDHTTVSGLELTIIATYQHLGGSEVIELIEAADEWGIDHLERLAPHEYEDARLVALSMFHAREAT